MAQAKPAATTPERVAGATFSAHYISGTHWDREWYRPVQEYRLLLVALIDELLDIMESDAAFRYFHLDGQTCVLGDYTDVRPENRPRLQALMKSGRVLVGPWFTMPDLFCPGDEALVRNLLLGRRIASEWGVSAMPVAYTCDMFGHPSQMPQIFRGFGLRHCVLGRGTNEHTTRPFFLWEAPDGSRVFCFKLQDSQGYGAFAAPRATIENPERMAEHRPDKARLLEETAGDPARRAAVLEGWCKEEIARYVEHEIARADTPVLCLMDAMDHIMPATDVAKYIRMVREACPSVEVRHSTLPAFFQEAEARCEGAAVRRGELREPSKSACGYLWLIPNCVSARVRMKQANDAAQALMEKWAEPFLAVANIEGAAIPARFLRIAWEHILLNHAHDSICGCSIDQVHRDMAYRFDQASILARQLRHKAFAALSEGAADLAVEKDDFTLTIANPAPVARREVFVFDVDLPPDYPATFQEGFRSQPIKHFTLHDASGREVPYQRLSFLPRHLERSRVALPCFCTEGEVTRYTVAAELELPALGYASFLVRPAKTRVRAVGSLRTGPTAAATEHLAICIDEGGTLAVTDRATGETYTDLLTFEDRSEIGDGWFHGESLNDEVFLSSACPAQVSVVHDGPEIVTFRSTVYMTVPARYDWHAERPSDERVSLAITSLISLRRGARVVDVETTLDNTAEDHRLRLLLPTDATRAQTWIAHHPFDLVERPIALDAATARWQEMEIAEKPFLGLQAVGWGRRGLAFISAGGVHEGGVADDERRTMTATLVRSFRRTVGTQGEADGLERGRITWRYRLLPFAGELPRTEALRELADLQAGIMCRQTGKRASGYPPMSGDGPATRGFIEQKVGALLVSAIKPAESGDGLVVRLWNPFDRPQKETLAFWRPVARADLVLLCEDAAEGPTPSVKGSEVTLEAPARGIVTVKIGLA